MASDEVYFDVQGPLQSAEKIAELLAKVSAGVLVTYFSFTELMDELADYRALRRQRHNHVG